MLPERSGGASGNPVTLLAMLIEIEATAVATRNGTEGTAMTRILVLYYSSYGHIARMAEAVAAGAREVGADVVVKRVPELVPDEVALKSGYKLDQVAPIAQPRELADYDAIIIGTPTRFGNMASQMKNFLDQTGGLWAQDKLVGKVGSVFTSTGSQHGGQESTILATHVVLLHLGMTIVGLPYTFNGQTRMDEITGGSPYGASTLAGDGDRLPSENELAGARFQGRHVAATAAALTHGRSGATIAT
jgi:NAD(P)H dehydrogenase (quinone)